MAWETAAFAAVLLSFGVAALLIALSRAFQYKELEQWAKAEMIFALSTVFIAALLVALFTQGEQIALEVAKHFMMLGYAQQGIYVSEAALGGGEATLLSFAKFYMSQVFDCMVTYYSFIYFINIPIAHGASMSADAWMADAISGWFLNSFVQTFMNFSNQIAFTLFIYYVFVHMLNFVEATALQVFLPAGILLRAFPPTRGVGAYVLAFVIGFYFVFPLAYIMLAAMYPVSHVACDIFSDVSPTPAMCGLENPGKPFETLLWADANTQALQASLSSIQQAISGFCVGMCCLPFLAMVVTMSAILSGTNLLGANLPEIGRGFVKLI